MTNEMSNVPELRFPEFSGEWRERRLGDIAIIKGRLGWKGLKNEEYIENGYAYLVAGRHIKNGVINWSSTDQINKYRYDESPEIALEQNDIIFSKDGSLGNPALIKSMNKPATINGTMMLVRVDTNKLNPHFFYQILLSSYFKRLIHLKVSGSSIPHLFQDDMKTFSIKATNLSEQEKIGCFFSKLDRQIELEEQKLEKLEEQKKGYMQQIFSQQLRFKDENGDYYSEWKEKLIKDILEFENNRRKPITSSLREIGKYPYYGATGIIDYVKDYIFDGETRLLIGEDGAKWGAFEESSFIAKNRYWVNNHAHVCKSKINNLVFLNYLLNYKELRTYVTGNAPAKLTYNNLSMIPMFLPSVYEQEKIGNFLKKIDEFIGKQNKKINELKIRKQGFLQKMFI